MRLSSKRTLGGVSLGLAGILGACQSLEQGEADHEGEAVRSYGSVGQRLEEAPLDTIETYSAKCDAATGIRVPAFSCTNLPGGPDQQANPAFAVIDQSSSADNIEGDPVAIGSPLTPSRTPRPEVSLTAFTLTAGGFGSVDQDADQVYFASTHLVDTFSSQAGGDEFSLAYLVEAQIDSLQAGTCTEQDCVPQAGVMIRRDDGPSAPFAMLSFQSDGKLVLKHRQSEGGTTDNVWESTQFSLPLRLRLQWDSAEMIAEVARDGEDWQRFGPEDPIPLPDGILPNTTLSLGGVAVAAATVEYQDFYTPRKCDRPNALSGTCQPESTFQVVERTADAVVVANCRKSASFSDDEFADIAVIQYNRKNGAVCFYQSPGEDLDGSLVQAPALGSRYRGSHPEGPCTEGDGNDPFCWLTPAETHDVGCTGCHDSTALIRSPYIMDSGLIPETGFKSREGAPLRYVGHAFNQDRSWLVEPPANDPAHACRTCHDLAVSNVVALGRQGGTAFRFATMATTPYQYEDPFRPVDPLFEAKNTVSETSPTWMPPDGLTSYPTLPGPNPSSWIPELQWANVYRDCAQQFWEAIGGGVKPPPYVDVPSSVPGGCEFIPYGTAFAPALGLLNAVETNIGGGGGSAEGNFDAFTLTSPVGSDVYDDADKAYTVSAIMQGDGYLTVKVTGLEATNPYAKAGLMFRESTDPSAKNVMLALTAEHGMQLHYRASTGGTTVQSPLVVSLPVPSLPVWLRLERSGNTVIGSISTDERNTWQRVAEPVTLSSFNPQVQSVVNTSHNDVEEGSATFQSLDFTPTQGWMGASDPHLLVDLNYGTSTGKRREWITEERMSSQGSDIYGAQDSALFSFKSFVGNGELQTIVKAFDPKTRFGKAGLMIRASGATNSANVFFGRIRDGLTFQHRQNAGGSTVSYNCENLPNLPERLMLRLVRNGSNFTAFYKGVDATSWTQMKNCSTNQNLTLTVSGLTSTTPALSGLAVSSESGAAATTATFWSGKTVEPPGFLWSAIGASPNTPEADPNPEPEPEPEPEGRPCDNFCAPAQEFGYEGQNNYQSNSLSSSERCLETLTPTSGGNCGQMGSRVLRVNGVQMPCNSAPWPTLPPAVNGGYCVHVTAGTPSYAWFSVHE